MHEMDGMLEAWLGGGATADARAASWMSSQLRAARSAAVRATVPLVPAARLGAYAGGGDGDLGRLSHARVVSGKRAKAQMEMHAA